MYNFVRSRQLEGTFLDGPEVGAWVTTGMRVARGLGSPNRAEWPCSAGTVDWPPVEPPMINQAAKRHRILAYQRVRNALECKLVLAQRAVVVAAFEINPAMWSGPQEGRIPMPGSGQEPTDTHTVLVCGYDDRDRTFLIRNSWGKHWGDRGNGRISYDYFDQYMIEAWTMAEHGLIRPPIEGDGCRVLAWQMPSYLGETDLFGFEVFDAARDECIGWAFIVGRNGFAEIEELFVLPSWRGRGYGRRLAQMIVARERLVGWPLRAWVPHVDEESVGSVPARQTLARLGLSLERPDQCQWSAWLAE